MFYMFHYRDTYPLCQRRISDLTETGACGILNGSFESWTDTYENYTESEATSPSDI